MSALADVFLSSRMSPAPPARRTAVPLSIIVPAGLEPRQRRGASLAAARRLARPGSSALVLLVENGHADIHVLGDLPCGHTGPPVLSAADPAGAVDDLLDRCDAGILALVDCGQTALRRAAAGLCACDTGQRPGEGGPARAVFLAAAEPESIVEAYHGLKMWTSICEQSSVALMLVGRKDAGADVHLERLRRAARTFLKCDVQDAGAVDSTAAGAAGHPALAAVDSSHLIEHLLAACAGRNPAGGAGPYAVQPAGTSDDATPQHAYNAAPPAPRTSAAAVECPAPPPAVAAALCAGKAGPCTGEAGPHAGGAVCPAFAMWRPADRGELIAAVRNAAGLLPGEQLRHIFEVGVEEPGAPPLAAVRGDGTLVAILLSEPGRRADREAAERWLAVHRPLLARSFPECRGDAGTASIVLEPLQAVASDGVCRFIPVRLGGHKGVLLLP